VFLLAAAGGAGLPFEVADAIGRNEKSPDGSVGVVGSEVSAFHIEPRNAAGLPFRFQNVFPGMAVPQLLGQVQILPLRDRAECAPVSFEVVVEKMLIAKSRSPGERKGC
jgi:hypothetical protein